MRLAVSLSILIVDAACSLVTDETGLGGSRTSSSLVGSVPGMPEIIGQVLLTKDRTLPGPGMLQFGRRGRRRNATPGARAGRGPWQRPLRDPVRSAAPRCRLDPAA